MLLSLAYKIVFGNKSVFILILLGYELKHVNLIFQTDFFFAQLNFIPNFISLILKMEFKQMDQKTKKLMMIHNALLLRDEMDRSYASIGLMQQTKEYTKKEQRKTDYSSQ